MKTNILLTISFFLIKNISLAQCTLFISGGDYPWCNPCEGSVSAFMTGGTPPYSYNWSTGDTTALVTNLCAGTYTVTASDNDGCVLVDSVTINQLGTPMTTNMTASAPSCPTCCDICISPNPSGGCVPYSYTWLPADPNWPPCSACPFETYTVTVTDACGCTAIDSITTDTVAVGTTGIHQIDQIKIGIYPNPSTNFIIVEVGNNKSTYTATITDIEGKIVQTVVIKNEKTIISTEKFTSGIYLINIADNKQNIYAKKWIKE